MKQIYVAASFAYEDKVKTRERQTQIEWTVSRIKAQILSHCVWYLPQQLKISDAWDMSLEEWCQKVYEADLNALNGADTIIFISFGKENNAGAVWEVGYTVGHNMNCVEEKDVKKIICIKMTDEPESLMVTQSADVIITKEEISSYDWNNIPNYKTKLNKLS